MRLGFEEVVCLIIAASVLGLRSSFGLADFEEQLEYHLVSVACRPCNSPYAFKSTLILPISSSDLTAANGL